MQALRRWAHRGPNHLRVTAAAVLIFSPAMLVWQAVGSYAELVLQLVGVVITGEPAE